MIDVVEIFQRGTQDDRSRRSRRVSAWTGARPAGTSPRRKRLQGLLLRSTTRMFVRLLRH